MWHSALRASRDESAAAWLTARLSGERGTVTGSVPDGFAAYARIFHPSEHEGRWCSWSEVAESTGRRVHALVQWHALVGSSDSQIAVAPGADVDVDELVALMASRALTEDELRAIRVELPRRSHLLFEGSLSALAESLAACVEAGGWPVSEFLDEQSPNLFWPADHAWCVASEIDFDSTLVAGSAELVDAVLRTPILEAWPLAAGDWLTEDADQINATPDR